MAHTPTAHVAAAWGKLHALPHRPQLPTLVLVFTSQPSPAMLLQLAKPALHVPTPHAPAAHVCVMTLASAQRLMHAPQWFGSALVLTSQPSPAVLLQLA
jgi:hypothetical protein